MFHKNSVKSTLFLVILWFHEFFSTLCTQRGSYVRKYTLSHLAKISWNQRKKLLNSWFDAIFFHTLYIAFRSAQCTFFEKNSVKLTKLHFSCFQEIFCESKFLVFRYCNATLQQQCWYFGLEYSDVTDCECEIICCKMIKVFCHFFKGNKQEKISTKIEIRYLCGAFLTRDDSFYRCHLWKTCPPTFIALLP